MSGLRRRKNARRKTFRKNEIQEFKKVHKMSSHAYEYPSLLSYVQTVQTVDVAYANVKCLINRLRVINLSRDSMRFASDSFVISRGRAGASYGQPALYFERISMSLAKVVRAQKY